MYLNGPVVWVKEEFCQSTDLWRAVPAVGAVHQHRPLFLLYGVHNHHRWAHQTRYVLQPLGVLQARQPAEIHTCTIENRLYYYHHHGWAHQTRYVLQPLGVLQARQPAKNIQIQYRTSANKIQGMLCQLEVQLEIGTLKFITIRYKIDIP